MSYSLNEVEATAKRATRGAGYAWGLAEEAAKATRWLCAQGLDGCAVLAAVLADTDRHGTSGRAPRVAGGEWHAGSEGLCPIMVGSAVSDFCDLLEKGDIRVGPTANPLMCLPFASAAARTLESPVTLRWQGCTATVGDGPVRIDGEQNAIYAIGPQPLQISLGSHAGAAPGHTSRAANGAESWAELNRFAARTYAPATEESRLLGAGAGLSDND